MKLRYLSEKKPKSATVNQPLNSHFFGCLNPFFVGSTTNFAVKSNFCWVNSSFLVDKNNNFTTWCSRTRSRSGCWWCRPYALVDPGGRDASRAQWPGQGVSTSFRVRKDGDFTCETGWFHSNMGDLAKKTYFLRVIPTLKHYSDIVSDIPSGSIYGIFILTFYLTFFLAYTLIYLSFYLASILTYFLIFWHSFWHLSGICPDILSGILFRRSFSGLLSGICPDILSDILSGILSDILSFVWLRSGSAHGDLELAVEARQCPLPFGACGCGPAVPTEIWSSQLKACSPLKSGARGWCPEGREEEEATDKI